MKPLVKWGLWQRRWSVMWWAIGIFVFIFLNLIFYPNVKQQTGQYEQIMAQIPKSAQTFIADTSDLFSATGYLSSQIFYLMMPMLLGTLAIGLGASLVGREEKEGTVELLLGRPVSRARFIAAKALLGLLILLIVGVFGSLATAIMARLVGNAVPFGNVLLAGLASIVLAASFGAVAFMITMLGRGARAASIGIASIVAIGGYVLTSLAGTVEWLKWPSKLFPFYYYRPGEILKSTYHWQNMLFIVAVIAVCGVISFVAFRRRDLTGQ